MTRPGRAALGLCGVLAIWTLTSAHVGSPDTWFEGKAGPYAVRVLIRAPQVIPARAEVVVRVLGCDSAPRCAVRRVTATPKIWNGGERGAPPPDEAAPVPGDSTLYTLMMWIMRQGSFAVLVHVEGAAGSGTAVVPFSAVATGVLGMRRAFAGGLAALGLFLAIGLVTIVGAATREAGLEPGQEPDATLRRRSLKARAIAVVVIVLVLTGGRAWWNAEHRAYAAAAAKPARGVMMLFDSGGGRVLRLTIRPDNPRDWAPLIPDHGKLLHLFLVKAGDLGALAHLHPVARDSQTFEAALPPLPAGRYHLYADLVFESGFAETVAETLTVAGLAGRWTPSDADDAVFTGRGGAASASFADGSRLEWTDPAAQRVAGEEADLMFALRDARGALLPVEPYLGMAAHAVVAREDGGVYVHLHQVGTASMVAQLALESWQESDSVRGRIAARLAGQSRAMTSMAHGDLPGTFRFPYAFPSTGRYRVWVQFRRQGTIRTAAFDVTVGT